MKSAIKRFFLVMMSAWLLIGHVGFAYQISECLVTGKKKLTWAVPVSTPSSSSTKESHISRSACYEYAHIQVKFGFDQQIKKLQKSHVEAQPLAIVDHTCYYLPNFSFVERNTSPRDFSFQRPLLERLAFIQRYNI